MQSTSSVENKFDYQSFFSTNFFQQIFYEIHISHRLMFDGKPYCIQTDLLKFLRAKLLTVLTCILVARYNYYFLFSFSNHELCLELPPFASFKTCSTQVQEKNYFTKLHNIISNIQNEKRGPTFDGKPYCIQMVQQPNSLNTEFSKCTFTQYYLHVHISQGYFFIFYTF